MKVFKCGSFVFPVVSLVSLLSPAKGATVVTDTLSASDINSLAGSSSGSFQQTFTDGISGISVTLGFDFTATGGPFAVFNSLRLGVDNGVATSTDASSSINLSEAFGVSVSLVSSSINGSGETAANVSFRLPEIGMFRTTPNDGAVGYDWASSGNASTVSYVVASGVGGGSTPNLTDAVAFNIDSSSYTGTLTVTSESGNNPTGVRIATDSIQAEVSFDVVPEPSASLLFACGTLGLLTQRRRKPLCG